MAPGIASARSAAAQHVLGFLKKELSASNSAIE